MSAKGKFKHEGVLEKYFKNSDLSLPPCHEENAELPRFFYFLCNLNLKGWDMGDRSEFYIN